MGLGQPEPDQCRVVTPPAVALRGGGEELNGACRIAIRERELPRLERDVQARVTRSRQRTNATAAQ